MRRTTYRLPAVWVLILLFSYGCKTTKLPDQAAAYTASITQEGFLTCFAPGTSLNGQPVWCEASAVLFDGNKLLFANDKDMPPGQSPVFTKTPETLSRFHPTAGLPDATGFFGCA